MLTLAVHFERKRTCLTCCLVHAELALDAHVERPAVPLGIVAGHGSVLTIWAQGRVYTGVLCACASASAALPPADGDTILAILVSAVLLTLCASRTKCPHTLECSRFQFLECSWSIIGMLLESALSDRTVGVLLDCSLIVLGMILHWSWSGLEGFGII